MTGLHATALSYQTPDEPAPPARALNATESWAWDRLVQWLPYFPRCSSQSNAALTRPRNIACRYPYITVCRNDYRAWLIFDLDHQAPFGHWDDCGLPPPNLIVRDPEKGSAHWYYAISPVYLKGRQHPISYAKAIYRAMVEKLGSDPDYAGGPVSKTPFHSRWETLCLHTEQYDLSDLQEYIEPAAPSYSADAPDDLLNQHTHSRHLWLFHATRFIAYRMVGDFYSASGQGYQAFFERFHEIVKRHNRFVGRSEFAGKGNLRPSQVRAVASSIARFAWELAGDPERSKRYQKNRGIMGLDSDLPLKARQALSAQRTHHHRRRSTQERIEAAVRNLKAEGASITFVAVAQASGLSRQTVAKYRDVIERVEEQLARKSPAPKLASSSSSPTPRLRLVHSALPETSNVNFGGHKITTDRYSPEQAATSRLYEPSIPPPDS
ncbi:hypothetical protein BTO32_15205 [Marinobacter lutaoensis]|uniref:Uncharacterized protein n=1 Tax=Marinobacter lutaoensis TaxID=135739 RepID=A0A1V2DPH3_9GAMM|nr:replication initiation protein [Marinobacter lutaoensis]ONF42553.1 hypothetical protein BTO32_15205 [Marinobacter lutaoensis]